MRNNNDKTLQFSELLNEATEEMLKSMNKIIADKQLPPQLVLSMLARIAAGYTHQYQRTLTDPQAKDSVEDVFIENYNLCLYDYDMHDINDVMEEMNKEHLN